MTGLRILSPQEIQILVGLNQGLSVAEIMDRLQKSRATIFRALVSARLKLHLPVEAGNAELVKEAVKLGYTKKGMTLIPGGIVAVTPKVAARLFLGARHEES